MAEKKKPKNKSERQSGKGKKYYGIRTGIRVFFLLLLALLLGMGAWFYARYGARLQQMQMEARQMVAESSEDTFRQVETSLVYDTDGGLISSLKGEKDVYYIDLKDIPSDTIEAMISIEDKKFYQHPGVDLKAIVRAAWALVQNKGEITQGASTITQQLARNIFLTHEETWERKVKEIFLAVELEKKYSKSQIMEFYLNNIYFANGFYGIQAASFGYFDRGIQELTLSEQAFLCAIPNSPGLYDPYQNPDNTLGRRDRILKQMETDGRISAEEAEEARQQEITLCRKERKKNNYIETFAYDCAVRALMKKEGFQFRYSFSSEEEEERYMERYNRLYGECQTSLYTGGYRVYTSLDQELQKELQKALDTALSGETGQSGEGVYELQGSAVTIDNDTGRVVAIVGGRSQALPGYTLNRAYQSYRQPGSAVKPLIVYTPAFEAGYSPEDLVPDQKEEDGPRNVDGVYAGEISILQAVAVSKNTVAWKLFQELTPARGLEYLLDMNFSRITAQDYYPAASLGGLTKGVSALEMTSAFATLEYGGIYREPTCILKIMDAEGNILVSEEDAEEYRVYEEGAVEKMNRCLLEVMNTGTGRRGALSGMPCAGKTGTTNEQKDKWFVGFTAYYTTGVWVGYDLPRSLAGLAWETEPLLIWKNFMEPLHQDREAVQIPAYVMPEPEEEIEPEQEDPTEEPDTEEPDTEEPDTEEPDIPEDGEGGAAGDDDMPGDNGAGEYPEEKPPEEDLPDDFPEDSGEEDEYPEEPPEEPDDSEPEGGDGEPPEDPSIGPEDLSPEDYWFFYGEEP